MKNIIFKNITLLKGVGEKTKKLLKKKKIEKISDLIWNLPQGFTDRTLVRELDNLEIGKITTFKVKVIKFNLMIICQGYRIIWWAKVILLVMIFQFQKP